MLISISLLSGCLAICWVAHTRLRTRRANRVGPLKSEEQWQNVLDQVGLLSVVNLDYGETPTAPPAPLQAPVPSRWYTARVLKDSASASNERTPWCVTCKQKIWEEKKWRGGRKDECGLILKGRCNCLKIESTEGEGSQGKQKTKVKQKFALQQNIYWSN